ncbi:non-structural maintenance of chromosome element 1-like protein [Encephalitozoon cuniculi]|nr:non-structural maintenance of chromosome element 1-like protein [Encephalitozoon cuniculi]
MDVSSIVLKLLTDGIVDGEHRDVLSSLNELLRPVEYEAVRWPDGSCIVLKDNRSSHPPDSRTMEIEEVFRNVVFGIPVSGDVVDMLMADRWIENVGGELRLSRKSLVQHMDFILGLGGRYVVCNVCGFLSEEGEIHGFCSMLLENERNSSGENRVDMESPITPDGYP